MQEEGLTNEVRHYLLHKQPHDKRGIAKSLNESYIKWARLTVWDERVFKRNIITLKNTPTPLYEEPLKFITHGCIFEKLWYMMMASFFNIQWWVTCHLPSGPQLCCFVMLLCTETCSLCKGDTLWHLSLHKSNQSRTTPQVSLWPRHMLSLSLCA